MNVVEDKRFFPHRFCSPQGITKSNGREQTAHGLRTIIRMHLNRIGIQWETAESIIDHETARRSLDKAYIQHNSYIDEKRPVMQAIGDFVEAQGMGLARFKALFDDG